MYDLKRLLCSLFFGCLLSSTLQGNVEVYIAVENPEITLKSVKPNSPQIFQPFKIKAKFQDWINQTPIITPNPKDEITLLEIKFPKVVIDDVIVYLDATPKHPPLLAVNAKTVWNHPADFPTSKEPG